MKGWRSRRLSCMLTASEQISEHTLMPRSSRDGRLAYSAADDQAAMPGLDPCLIWGSRLRSGRLSALAGAARTQRPQMACPLPHTRPAPGMAWREGGALAVAATVAAGGRPCSAGRARAGRRADRDGLTPGCPAGLPGRPGAWPGRAGTGTAY